MDEREASLSAATFDSEAPVCPFRKCDMHSNHEVVGRGWDFEYASTHDEIELLQCRTCRLIFPREIPVEAALPIIYPKTYYSFSETKSPNALVMAVRAFTSRAKAQMYMDMVPKEDAQVVDIGCGDGRMLDVLSASCPPGWRFHGIDWSDDAVERVRSKGYDGRRGDISSMDLSEWQGKFDLAIMHQLVEHVRDPRDLLTKVKSMLRPDGVLSVETPDIDAWDFRLLSKRYWAGYHIPRHFYIFDKKNFAELAQQLGFEVVGTRSLVNPVFWIHSIQSYFADNKWLARFAKFFHHQNVLMLALFTPLEILQTRLSGTSSNMQINLRKIS